MQPVVKLLKIRQPKTIFQWIYGCVDVWSDGLVDGWIDGWASHHI